MSRASALRFAAMRNAHRDPYREPAPPPADAFRADEQRIDGWANVFAGFGVRGRDPSLGDVIVPPKHFSRAELEWCFRGDAIAARCMAILPDSALRNGWQMRIRRLAGRQASIAPEEASEIVQDTTEYLRVRDGKKTAQTGLIDAQTFGGALIVVGYDDGQPFEKPLKEDAVKSVYWFRELDRFAVEPGPLELDPRNLGYGKPQWYEVASPSYGTRERIHATRCIRIDGIYTPKPTSIEADANKGWSDSALTPLWDPLRHFNMAIAAVARAIRDFARAWYKIKGLHQQVAGNRIEEIRRRMEVAELSLSALNAMMLDADGEDFGFMGRPVAGMGDLFDRLGIALAAARGCPITELLGLSPGGLGTGEDEDRRWTNRLGSYRDDEVVPVLERMHRAVLLAKDGPTKGKVPDRWGIEMSPLRTPTPKEVADTRKTWVDAVVGAVREQVLLAEEAAEGLFGRGEFSMDISLDREARQAMADAQEAAEADDELNAALQRTRGEPEDDEG